MNHLGATKGSAAVPDRSEPSLVPRSLVAEFDPPHHRWMPLLERLVLAGLLAAFVGFSFLPGWRTLNSEFPNYYLAAALYHRRIPLDRIYEWTWFQRQNDHLGVRDGLVSFAPNPPSLILSLAPIMTLQPLAAKRAWLALNLVFLAVSLGMLRRVTSFGWRRLGLISLLCMVPLHVDFLFGRHYVLVLMLICGAYYSSCLDRRRTSGVMLAAAAAMKLFPALFVIMFVWKRNWRAVMGMALGATAITALSLFMFGVEVHRVFLTEVLSQASRGDWLGPYALSQNSFITLWSHLFLIEPELNPFPLINSPTLYAVAQAATVTVLLFSFLLSARGNEAPRSAALQWAALIPLLLLLSTTMGPDYPCLLIFTAVVGLDALLATAHKSQALILLFLYVAACAPVPHQISNWFPLTRLLATIGLYVLLLHSAGADRKVVSKHWLAAGLISAAILTIFNLNTLRNRAEDFSRRLPSPPTGYRAANPVATPDGVVFTEMEPRKYEPVLLREGAFRGIAMPGDALSVAGSGTTPGFYSELTGRQSWIARVPTEGLGSAPEMLTEGQDPALSHDGRWLAFIREGPGGSTAWLLATDSSNAPLMVLPSAYHALDVAVTSDGDVIVAAGRVSDPHLFMVRHGTEEVVSLTDFPHPARYPSASPDGKRLAFSRRDHGFWHLAVRELATGYEQDLTHASCNATSPTWENAQTLLYATDCGRGVGLSAIARVALPQ
jgi:hypothetical protein